MIVTARSGNQKLGPIPAVSRGQSTCPIDCPLMGSGCYGENRPGRPSIFDTVSRSRGADRGALDRLAERKSFKLPPRAMRFNVVGDYLRPDGSGRVDTDYIGETNRAATALRERFGTVSWSYTHAWTPSDRRDNVTPDLFSYIVRASCQSAEEVERALWAGWRACIVVADYATMPRTIGGQAVVPCPVTTGQRETCADCRLCGRDAPSVVAFKAHGKGRRRALEVLA